MTTYRTRDQINFGGMAVIQLGTTAGNQFGNNIPADTQLVFENGIWKYPDLVSSGAVVVTRTCRLVGLMANFGGSIAWTLSVAGNANNTSGEPYPSGDAALYAEGTFVVAGTTSQYAFLEYPFNALPLLMPGQRVYLTTVAAVTPRARLVFRPEL